MMMSLDLFVFELGTLPYQEFARATEWKHAQSERFGARAASQFIGIGGDKITLTGALCFELSGSYSSLDTIHEMADKGEAYALMSGTGTVMGNWFIRSFNVSRNTFFVDGVARKADFTLELERTDDA